MFRVILALVLLCCPGVLLASPLAKDGTGNAGPVKLFYEVNALESGLYHYEFDLRSRRGVYDWIIVGSTPHLTDPLFPEGKEFLTTVPGHFRASATAGSFQGPTLIALNDSCFGLGIICSTQTQVERGFVSTQFSGISSRLIEDGELTWMYLRGEESRRGQVMTAARLANGATPTMVPLPLPVLLLGFGVMLLGALKLRRPA